MLTAGLMAWGGNMLLLSWVTAQGGPPQTVGFRKTIQHRKRKEKTNIKTNKSHDNRSRGQGKRKRINSRWSLWDKELRARVHGPCGWVCTVGGVLTSGWAYQNKSTNTAQRGLSLLPSFHTGKSQRDTPGNSKKALFSTPAWPYSQKGEKRPLLFSDNWLSW